MITSGLSFRDVLSDRPRPELMLDSVVSSSSGGLGWDGVVVERGFSRTFEAHDAAVAGHFVGMNLGAATLIVTDTSEHDLRTVALAPGAFLILPARTAFSLRMAAADWGAVELSLDKVRRVVGADLCVLPAEALVDEPLAAVVRALLSETATSGASGALYADALVVAVVRRLASMYEVVSPRVGPLSKERLAVVCALIDERIADPISVKSLALGTGLSPAHFSREFKRTTGETPHVFVMRRRLAHAHDFLGEGGSIAEAAQCSGFADQAHLSRLFKQRYLVTPGAFRRRYR